MELLCCSGTCEENGGGDDGGGCNGVCVAPNHWSSLTSLCGGNLISLIDSSVNRTEWLSCYDYYYDPSMD